MRLIPLTDRKQLKEACPIALSTLYKWRSTGEHSDLTVKVSGKVCLNVNALDEMVNASLEKQRAKAERIRKIRNELKKM